MGLTDAEAKAKLGKRTREKKVKACLPDLRKVWLARLDPTERDQLAGLRSAPKISSAANPVEKCLDLAVEHCFERASVSSRRELIASALRFGAGAVTVEAVERGVNAMALVERTEGEHSWVTTPEVLAEEDQCIRFVVAQRGRHAALNPEATFKGFDLSAEQREAAERLLGSYDGVMAIRGAAGTGKTAMMKLPLQR
ncbi:MAG: AAA family ATPase [Candidatus Competibacteraceae bacterium]|nr:AAA family ATPase [Candidatus Competibacteraceae bacterium]